MTPTVSIILGTFNRAAFLGEAIESVLRQTFEDWELIIINDGSTDGTDALAKDFAAKDKRIRYYSQKRRGLSGLRSEAPGLARGRYLAFLDDDDIFYPEKLEHQARYLDEHPSVGLVYGVVDMVDQKKCFLREWPVKPAANFRELIRQCTIQPNACLVRRECFDQVGTFNFSLNGCDDYEMWLRIARHYPIAFVNEKVGFYRWHADNYSLKAHLRIRNLVNVYQILIRSYDLTREERAEVYRAVLRITYFQAIEKMKKHCFRSAAFYFRFALQFDLKIGSYVGWSKFNHALYRILKPYLAVLYCQLCSLFTHEKFTGSESHL